ncbi:glycosyl transferase family 21 [Phreatobacter oligotrophus]|uniref:Glycosyl transferase family 21 n=2 Tax=Phreatobacter oligotrophus TaxID=1122261 RepID=A0A2T4YWE0_9HYPH|nr:glycosyl transferase family 21 [Phreatobacter oligotrophus]
MSLGATYAAWKYRQLMEQMGDPAQPAKALVIVPMKGQTPHTRAFLQSLLSQDHPDYRVVIAVESLADPAVAAADFATRGRPVGVKVVEAGLSADCGQKVWNLTRALDEIDAVDHLVVMADADVILPRTWLSNLNWAVIDQGQDIVTGYRLIVPASESLAARMLTSINLSFALVPRITGLTAAWGGTMAMRRETLEKLEIRRYWRNALSDDLQLTAAARDKGILVHTNRRTLLVTPWGGDISAFWSFGVRQFRIFRMNNPFLFLGLVAFQLLPILGWGSLIVGLASGSALALMTAPVMAFLALYRQRLRWRVVREACAGIWNVDERQPFFDAFGRPIWWPAFLALGLSGMFGHTINWAGITYRCRGARVTGLKR